MSIGQAAVGTYHKIQVGGNGTVPTYGWYLPGTGTMPILNTYHGVVKGDQWLESHSIWFSNH